MASLHQSLPSTCGGANEIKILDIETSSTLEIEGCRGPIKNVGEIEEEGRLLTWKDVWVVTASSKKKGSKSILQGLTGYAKPGELLAIMGPSGCGKSTLLDTLAGRLGSKTRLTGEILINGHKRALTYGNSAYVRQDNTLLTTLTVREAVHYSAQLQLPDTMSKAEKKERADFTIREMGLQDAINTRIGGWGCKGISGGQKRRVSICIEILTRPRLLFLDEPTSGLDSAASYYVMRRIANLAQNDNTTVIASIHQPSTEVFQLFDNLCLLSSGSTVYFGPASAATQDSNSTDKKRRHAGFFNQCIVLTKRSFVNMYRDLGYYWLRFVIYVALAIALATIYYDLGNSYDSIKDRGSLIAFINGFLTFMTIGGFPSFVEVMKVFQRERQNGHYGVTAFAIGDTISSIPYLLFVTLIPGAITYYLPGLQKGYDHFLYFTCVLFSSLMLVESLMMIVACIVPNFLMGIITGAGIQGIMILLGGFFKLPNNIPKPVWKYPLHYVAFHTYANQGLFKNEYEGLIFVSNQSFITGEEVLRNIWQSDMGHSKWVDLAILVGMIAVYRVLFLIIIKINEKVKPIIVSLLSLSGSHKRTIQVMENPNATPLHSNV
ncbi:hypothetical protein RJT34_04165 [Clitoria ternatea]|uniref:ABC transporter domain-containing protein n=1 Tax=Clitoria ternatea TaxID=43366 RepID=A0AAN9Q362_CLITE